MQLSGSAERRKETFFKLQKEHHEHLIGAQMTRYNVAEDGSKLSASDALDREVRGRGEDGLELRHTSTGEGVGQVTVGLVGIDCNMGWSLW
jgi:hypothetical protein